MLKQIEQQFWIFGAYLQRATHNGKMFQQDILKCKTQPQRFLFLHNDW